MAEAMLRGYLSAADAPNFQPHLLNSTMGPVLPDLEAGAERRLKAGEALVALIRIVVKPRGVPLPPQFAACPHFESIPVGRAPSTSPEAGVSTTTPALDSDPSWKPRLGRSPYRLDPKRHTSGCRSHNVRSLRESAPLFCAALAVVRREYAAATKRVSCRLPGCGATLMFRGSSMLQHVYKHNPERLFGCPLASECGFVGASFSFIVVDHIRKRHAAVDPYAFVDDRPQSDSQLAQLTRDCFSKK